ncbi:fungal-specific transcription factor domain-containing protein [Zychaea mexicana]|uniref:fungal-specific transcription factor domain-containing protein n=1 Tax=Zychaea mexicana TaxID=64656 RepID=UPI0022FF1B5A|nr:fungal-specific transcription factor domain-containing protein [Zychaea mexicana]KAI9484563.1 fungal-specific transcription factor domain-containing protein [Zychaea mexicana]
MPEDITKRQRVSKACEQCRRKKVKCDGASPLCSNCVALDIQCTYKESTRKRGPPKGYIEAIEGRLHRLEALLGSIVQEGDPRFQAVMNELNAPLETAYGELVRPRPMQRSVIAGFEEGGQNTSIAEYRDAEELQRNPTDMGNSMTTIDSVNDNMCNLSIDESGQLRYYGRSSGFYMLQGSKNFQNGSFQFGSDDAIHSIQQRVDPFEMPPDDLSKHLLELYFEYFYPFIPLLHKKSFIESLNSKDKPPSPLLLNAIYAVASRVSPDPRVRADPDHPDTAGDVFFERARLLLDFEWNNFRVSTVQSLLLMSSHQNGALKPTRGWIYSGMAFRMAQNLGLHRNCDTWNLSAAQKEDRKRAFFCCFVIDRLTCAMHGRAPMIDERDYDTPYPTEQDEDDLNRTPRIMDNFIALVKLCEILGDVLRDLYMVKGRKQLSVMATPDSVISTLDRALNQWMAKLPPSLRYRPPNTRLAERAPAPALELCQVHMLFYTTLILLHRPFIPGPTQSIAPSVFPSASICTFAANKILDIAESIFADGRLTNVNNYSLYFMFTAGIIFIYNAASTDSMFSFEAKISINKTMRAMDEVEKTWITSARHCNILGELAGLREINLSGVDDSYRRRTSIQRQTNAAPASIAVPNSPVMMQEETTTTATHQQQQQQSLFPLSQDATEDKYSNYYAVFNEKSPPRCNGYSVHSPPQNVAQTPPLASAPSPSSATTANMPVSQGGARPFDPLATAFWGMPTSFDIDEWNSYFNNQNPQRPQQQEQQQSTPQQQHSSQQHPSHPLQPQSNATQQPENNHHHHHHHHHVGRPYW